MFRPIYSKVTLIAKCPSPLFVGPVASSVKRSDDMLYFATLQRYGRYRILSICRHSIIFRST